MLNCVFYLCLLNRNILTDAPIDDLIGEVDIVTANRHVQTCIALLILCEGIQHVSRQYVFEDLYITFEGIQME